MEKISSFIRSLPNLRTLNDFFLPHDIYKGRMMERWEMKIMFPSLQIDEEEAIFNRFCEKMNPDKVDMEILALELSKFFHQGF